MGKKGVRRNTQRYSPEFRDEALRMVEAQPEKAVKVIAEELGIPVGTLIHWVGATKKRKAKAEESGEAPLSETEREELLRLRKKTAQLEMEREILKKAAAFFAKESQ